VSVATVLFRISGHRWCIREESVQPLPGEVMPRAALLVLRRNGQTGREAYLAYAVLNLHGATQKLLVRNLKE